MSSETSPADLSTFKIRIERMRSGAILLRAPWLPAAVELLHSVRGFRWYQGAVTFPASSQRALYKVLRCAFSEQLVLGPKGLFKLEPLGEAEARVMARAREAQGSWLRELSPGPFLARRLVEAAQLCAELSDAARRQDHLSMRAVSPLFEQAARELKEAAEASGLSMTEVHRAWDAQAKQIKAGLKAAA